MKHFILSDVGAKSSLPSSTLREENKEIMSVKHISCLSVFGCYSELLRMRSVHIECRRHLYPRAHAAAPTTKQGLAAFLQVYTKPELQTPALLFFSMKLMT